MLVLLLSAVSFLTPHDCVAQNRSFLIGGVFGLTGEAAAFGREELNAAQLAIEEVNAQGPIHLTLKVEDSASTGLGTVSAVKKLLELDGIKYIIGPTWLDTFQGCLPLIERRGVLAISPSASMPVMKRAPSQYPLVFSTYFNFQREVSALMENASRQGLKRVTILFDQDPYFVEMRRIANEAAKNFSIEIVVDQEFSSGETNFHPLILQAQRARSDAMIFASANHASALAFVKQRNQLAPSLIILGSHDFEGHERNPAFGGLLHNILYMAPDKPSQDFLTRYRDKYSTTPIMTAPNSFDSVMFLSNALRSGAQTPEQVAGYLQHTEHDSVSFGKVRFSVYGGIESGNFIARGALINDRR